MRGIAIFTEEEKIQLKIKNFGEFEFSKDEKSNKFVKKVHVSDRINDILKDSKEWNDTADKIVIFSKKIWRTIMQKSWKTRWRHWPRRWWYWRYRACGKEK